MNWFINLRTRTKLLISFLMLILLLGLVGATGIYFLGVMDKDVDSMYNDGIRPIVTLTKIEDNFQKIVTEMQRIIWKAQVVNDKTALERSVAVIEELTKENNKLLEEYSAYQLSEEEKVLLENLGDVLVPYRELRTKSIEAARQNNFQLAIQLNDEANVERDKTAEILDKLVQLSVTFGDKLQESTDANYARAVMITLIVIILGIVIGVILSLVIGNMLSRPINAVVQHAELFAKGDFSKDLPENLLARKDEMGILVEAFDDVNKNLRTLLKQVLSTAEDMSASSEELSASAEEVTAQGQNVNSATQQIAAGMEETSASTEEVMASGVEMESGSHKLFEKAREGSTLVQDIEKRAEQLKLTAQESRQVATNIYREKQTGIMAAIKEGEVVQEIELMAKTISDIAG